MCKLALTVSPSNIQENELKNKFFKSFVENSINIDDLPDVQVRLLWKIFKEKTYPGEVHERGGKGAFSAPEK